MKKHLFTLLLAIPFISSKAMQPAEDPLIAAIKAGNRGAIIRMIQAGADVNAPSNPLARAFETKDEGVCKLLLDHGANPDRPDARRQLLGLAIIHDLKEMYRLLSDAGADCQIYDIWIEDNIFELALHFKKAHLIPTIITQSNFNPFISSAEFKKFLAARKKVATILGVCKQYYPQMPKEIKGYILSLIPELKEDLTVSCKFGKLQAIQVQNIVDLPLPLLNYLIRTKYMSAQAVITQLKQHALAYFESLAQNTMSYARETEEFACILPRNLELKYAQEMEKAIRRRLSKHNIGLENNTACVIQ